MLSRGKDGRPHPPSARSGQALASSLSLVPLGRDLFGVAHARDRETLLAHKRAIDRHLEEAGARLRGAGVYWSVRSCVRPSELMPERYADWCRVQGIDVEAMRAARRPAVPLG